MDKGRIIGRIIFDIVIAVAVIHGWWFIALPVAIGGAWLFPYFVEIFIAGVIYDSLFGMIQGLGLRGYIGTIVSAILLVIVVALKRVVRK